jgi:hypothetical protein
VQRPPRGLLEPALDGAAGRQQDPDGVGEALGLHRLLQLRGERPFHSVEGASPQCGHVPSGASTVGCEPSRKAGVGNRPP